VQLHRLEISNFKSLRGQTFEPTRFGCLVGENNAGKSSVLQAVATALNRPAQLAASHFYDPHVPVELKFTIADVAEGDLMRLAEEHRPRIASLLVDGSLSFCVRYAPGEKVSLTAMRLLPSDPRYAPEAIDAAFEGRRGAVAIQRAFEDSFPELVGNIPDGGFATQGAAKRFVDEWIANLPREQKDLRESPLPSGMSASITLLLPEPIYIPAVKNLNDELKTTQSTSFGRLLGLLLEDMAPDLGNITESLSALNAMFNRVVEGEAYIDRRHEKVRSLESRVEAFLGENFPSAKVELHIPPPELKTILNAAQIFIDDGSRDLVDNKGDGIKRSLTFALLQAFVHRMDEQAANQEQGGPIPRPLLFLFEEPELYLHPKSQRVLFGTLAKIAHTHQVVVTTHSPLFFEPGVTASFVRVAKRAGNPKPEGALYPVNFELSQQSAETFRLARFEHADAGFFSQRVVLFEGESDDAYCRHIAKLFNPDWDFARRGIALVRVSGKGNFQKFRIFFESFGIDVKIVADLDALFDGYQHLGANDAAAALRNTVLLQLDQRVQALQIKADPSASQVQRHVQHATWRGRYENARQALREVQRTGQATAETIALIDSLFTWEEAISRLKVCTQDDQAAAALVPLLDALRGQGICVLARGAIEDYYPEGAPASGAKPDRALTACSLVQNLADAQTLSSPLGPARRTELQEIFEELFA
jgi:putative ATP-dependent endonuclease of the OLD family